jgi:hypothetical protein
MDGPIFRLQTHFEHHYLYVAHRPPAENLATSRGPGIGHNHNVYALACSAENIRRKISASLRYVTVSREGKMEMAKGEQDGLCAIASPPAPVAG